MANTETPIEKIEKFVLQQIENLPEAFLIEIKSAPGNNISVLLDADDGITIDRCIKINRALYKYIEESNLFPDNNFSLEVSSPGVDRPLQLHRQYLKNVGRKVEVLYTDGTKLEGTLTTVNDEGIKIEQQEGKGKKMIKKEVTILFNEIKHTTVLITF
jgi:ribosome maturation factor RimP